MENIVTERVILPFKARQFKHEICTFQVTPIFIKLTQQTVKRNLGTV